MKKLLLLLVLGSSSAHSFKLNIQDVSSFEIMTECIKYPFCSTEKNSLESFNK